MTGALHVTDEIHLPAPSNQQSAMIRIGKMSHSVPAIPLRDPASKIHRHGWLRGWKGGLFKLVPRDRKQPPARASPQQMGLDTYSWNDTHGGAGDVVSETRGARTAQQKLPLMILVVDG